MAELGLEILKKLIFFFSSLFTLLSLRYPKKPFVMGYNMYTLAIAIHIRYFLRISKLHEQFFAQKVQKISFFDRF